MTEYEIDLNIKNISILLVLTITAGYILLNYTNFSSSSELKFTGNILSDKTQTYKEPEEINNIRERLSSNIIPGYALDTVTGFDDEKLPDYLVILYNTEGKPIPESERSVEHYTITYKNQQNNTHLKYTTLIFSKPEFAALSFEYKELFMSEYNSSQIQNQGYSNISKIKFKTTHAVLFEKTNTYNRTIERKIVYIRDKQKIKLENKAELSDNLLSISELEDFSKQIETAI